MRIVHILDLLLETITFLDNELWETTSCYLTDSPYFSTDTDDECTISREYIFYATMESGGRDLRIYLDSSNKRSLPWKIKILCIRDLSKDDIRFLW